MSSKIMNLILIITGGLLMILSLLADLIGIGSYPGINWAQILGTAVGLAVLVIGMIRTQRKSED